MSSEFTPAKGEGARVEEMTAKTKLSHAEMFVFLLGARIDREEQPRSADDLVGQTWRCSEDGWELVEDAREGE